jgi:hypothetical protein
MLLYRSAIIDDLKRLCEDSTNSNIGLAYFYFNYRTPSSVLGVALALLEQLYVQSWTLAMEVLDLEERAAKSKEIAIGDVIPVLLSLASRFRKSYIVIDALDECIVSYQHDLVRLLSSIIDSRCCLLVLSRPTQALELVQDHPKVVIHPTLDDIITFTEAQISQKPRFKHLSNEIRRLIIERLSRVGTEHGMYAQLLQLSNCLCGNAQH